MKGYRLDDFTSLDDLRLQEEDDPRLQRGEVLVRVHAVSLNFRDIAMLRRFRPGGDRRVREASRGARRPPRSPCLPSPRPHLLAEEPRRSS